MYRHRKRPDLVHAEYGTVLVLHRPEMQGIPSQLTCLIGKTQILRLAAFWPLGPLAGLGPGRLGLLFAEVWLRQLAHPPCGLNSRPLTHCMARMMQSHNALAEVKVLVIDEADLVRPPSIYVAKEFMRRIPFGKLLLVSATHDQKTLEHYGNILTSSLHCHTATLHRTCLPDISHYCCL